MPGTDNDTDDLDLNDDVDLDADADTADDADTDTDTDDAADTDGDVDKRIRDLQSKADKAEARANKAEKALAAKNSKADGGAAVDPAVQALMADLREASLDAVMVEFAELTEYGIDRSLIEGSTRAEVRESATALRALVKKVATTARNKALADAGVTAEPAGSRRTKLPDFASMTSEEFNKYVEQNRG